MCKRPRRQCPREKAVDRARPRCITRGSSTKTEFLPPALSKPEDRAVALPARSEQTATFQARCESRRGASDRGECARRRRDYKADPTSFLLNRRAPARSAVPLRQAAAVASPPEARDCRQNP